MPESVQNSLQEIANLLRMIYDMYLKDVIGSENILIRLLHFVDSVEFPNIFMLDVERCRRKAMKTNDSMGYDTFYCWLKDISSLVYGESISDVKMAFHELLVNYILPWGASYPNAETEKLPKSWVRLSAPALNTFVDYSQFMYVWFYKLIDPQVSVDMRVHKGWTSELTSKRLTLENLNSEFQTSGICPCIIGSSQLVRALMSLPSEITGLSSASSLSKWQQAELTFSTFLLTIEYIANSIHQSSTDSSSAVEQFLQAVSNFFMAATLRKFLVHDSAVINKQKPLHNSTGQSTNQTEQTLSLESIFWLLRQAGVTRFSGVKLTWLGLRVNSFVAHSDTDGNINKGSTDRVALRKIPELLVFIVKPITRQFGSASELTHSGPSSPSPGEDQAASDCANTSNSTSSLCAVLAHCAPLVFFASPVQIPSMLGHLYSSVCIARLNDLSDVLSVVVDGICAASVCDSRPMVGKTVTSHSSALSQWTIKGLLAYCTVRRLVPSVVRTSLLRDTCAYVFGKQAAMILMSPLPASSSSLSSSSASHALASESLQDEDNDEREYFLGDLMEVLFVLAQLCLGGGPGTSETPNHFQHLVDLLTTFSTAQPTSQPTISTANNVLPTDLNMDTHDESGTHGRQAIQHDDQASAIAVAPQSSGEVIGSSLHDVMVLLVHFPLNSLRMNPWEVVQIFITMSRNEEGTSLASSDNSQASLASIFKIFCKQYSVHPEEIANYFSTHYESVASSPDSVNSSSNNNLSGRGGDRESMRLKARIRQALRDPMLDLMLADRTLRLLFANADLLKWEYCRCLTKFASASDPFIGDLIAPIPTCEVTEQQPEGTMLPCSSVHGWLVCFGLNLSPQVVSEQFSAVDVFSSEETSSRLTFSRFILFAVRCFTHSNCFNPDGSVTNITLDEFVDRVRSMLQRFSDNITNIQQALRMRVLVPLYSHKCRLDSSDRKALVRCSISHFETYNSSIVVPSSDQARSRFKCLAPRPPAAYWDAPRFVEFCKFVGLLNHVDAIIVPWCAFGQYFRSMNPPQIGQWGVEVVPPLPIKIDVAAALGLLETFAQLLNITSSGTDEVDAQNISGEGELDGLQDKSETATVDKLLSKIMTPILCAFLDFQSSPSLFSSKLKLPTSSCDGIEDLLRYGGDRVAVVMAELREWLEGVHIGLAEASSATGLSEEALTHRSRFEVPVNLACKYLSCQGLLKIGAVAIQAKKSLQSRLRPGGLNQLGTGAGSSRGSPASRHDVALLTISEFEELFMRCALLAWNMSDVCSTGKCCEQEFLDQHQANNTTLFQIGHLPSIAEVAARYCGHCENNARVAKSSPASSWGVNYISCYAMTLQECGFPDESAEIVQAKSPEPRVTATLEASDENLTSSQQFQSFVTSGNAGYTDSRKVFNAVESSQQPEAVHYKPPETIKVLIGNAAVIARSGELLSDILSGRFDHAISDPLMRSHWQDTEDQHAGESEARILDECSPSPTPVPVSSSPRTASLLSSSSSSLRPASAQPLRPPIIQDSNAALTNKQLLKQMIETGSSTDSLAQSDRETEMYRMSMTAGTANVKTPILLAIETLLEGTKEALWPVYATYCSCGDSVDPGKLSGPNLFTLLSKLGVLTDQTVLSDLGILLHQISAHTHAQSPLAIAMMSPDDVFDSPSLSFEEFLVFLCAFSQLRFEGVVSAPMFMGSEETIAFATANKRNTKSNSEKWFEQWHKFMASSTSFRRLLEQCVLPILKRYPLLAFPEDARHRDKYAPVFSLEVLLAIEGTERPLQATFERESGESAHHYTSTSSSSSGSTGGASTVSGSKSDREISIILSALRRINLVPQVIGESQVMQLVKDVMPDRLSSQTRAAAGSSARSSEESEREKRQLSMVFPQWEWVLSVVAFEAVENAVLQSSIPTPPDKIPSLVADVITAISAAMKKTSPRNDHKKSFS